MHLLCFIGENLKE